MPSPDWRRDKNASSDAVGAGTPADDGKNAGKDRLDFLSRENQRLATENRNIRRCLMLVKENCDLQTLNYLSHAMAMCDTRLRSFLTDVVVSAPTVSTVKDTPDKGPLQTNPVPMSSFERATSKNKPSSNDSTYGQSFPELQLSDIRSSYDGNSASNSYGRSFPEIDPKELEGSNTANKTNLQSQREVSVKWIDPDEYSEQMSNQTDSRSQPKGTSVDGSLKSIMKQPSPKVKEAETKEATQISQEPAFYDSLEASQRRPKSYPARNQAEVSQPPMKFSLNPNPLLKDPYGARLLESRRESRSNRANSVRSMSSKRAKANQSVSGVESEGESTQVNKSLHLSDLNSESHPSAFRQYKVDTETTESASYPNARTTQQDRDMLKSENTSPDTNYRAVSMGIYQGQSQGHHITDTHQQQSAGGSFSSSVSKSSESKSASNGGVTSEDATCDQKVDDHDPVTCDACQSDNGQSDNGGLNQSYTIEKGRRCPHCKHLLQDDPPQADEANPPILVRVNTTLGRSNEKESLQVSDLYAIPTGTRTPTPTLLDRSVINQSHEGGNKEYRIPTPKIQMENAQQSPGPYSGQSVLTNGSAGSVTVAKPNNASSITPANIATRPKATAPTKVTTLSDESREVMRNTPGDDTNLAGTNKDSMFRINRQLFRSERTDFNTTPTFGRESQQPVSYDSSVGGKISLDSEATSEVTMIGKPLATSTPVPRRAKSPVDYMGDVTSLPRPKSPYMDDVTITPRPKSPRSYMDDVTTVPHPKSPRSYMDDVTITPRPKSPRALKDDFTLRQQTPPSDLYNSVEARPGSEIKWTREKRSSSAPPLRSTMRKTEYNSPIESALARILGFVGQGAVEKVKCYLYRAVDILTGYEPVLTSVTPTLLEKTQASRRMVGEIAFQLDRRLLEFVIAGYPNRVSTLTSFRYYGYSLTNIYSLIRKEATVDGNLSPAYELSLRRRFDFILNKLKPFGYDFDYHAEFTRDMVNKYGLLSISSSDSAAAKYGLRDIAMIRLKLCQLLKIRRELDHMMIVFDCLCCLAYEDGREIFIS